MRAVDPNVCIVEHCTKSEEHTLPHPAFRQLNYAPIDPDPSASTQVVKLCLPWCGYFDAAHLCDTDIVASDVKEFPSAVQINSRIVQENSPASSQNQTPGVCFGSETVGKCTEI